MTNTNRAKSSGPSRGPHIDGKGYEGDPCPQCGQTTLVRNGISLTCDTCGFKSPSRCPFCESSKTVDTFGGQDIPFMWKLDIHPVSPGHMLVIPRRHVTNLSELTQEEWAGLHDSIKNAITAIENLGPGIVSVYKAMLIVPLTENSPWFIQRALAHPCIGKKPDSYNHGLNDGREAGRTVEHLHWHIIPRYQGDVDDPRGGVRFVIPAMGNYSDPRQ